MSVYYVSTAGNDSNNGLGPDASHASNKPWRTVAKALGAAGISSGDTVYVGPGVYRETVTVAMTSATAETKVYGDPCNKQGFKNGSGVLLSAQPVRWTAWTTDDKTTPAANALLTLAGRDFLTFQDIVMVGTSAGNYVVNSTSTGAATDITFRRCLIFSPAGSGVNGCINVNATGSPAGTALNWVIENCILANLAASTAISFTSASSASADFDLNVRIQNSLIACLGGSGISMTKSGANSFLSGGIDVSNCTILVRSSGLTIVTGGSTSIPCTIYNSVVVSASGPALGGVSTGDITENYNILNSVTARTNVSGGANSVTSYCPLINLGQAELMGFLGRQAFSPTFDSPILGFGTDGSVSLTTDLLGRDRPSGCGITWANTSKAVGCYEFHDFEQLESTVTDSGGGRKLVGPGDGEVVFAVDATSTTISLKVRYDTNHGTGSKPQIELLAAEDIGVSGQTLTASVGVDTWETLTFSAITPTAKGFVRVRIHSRAAAGNGLCYYDTANAT